MGALPVSDHVSVEEVEEPFDDERANTRVPLGQGAGPQEQHGAHDLGLQRRADPGAVGKNEIALQYGRVVRRDAGVGELAEAGIDAVDGRPAARRLLDDGRGPLDCAVAVRVEPNRQFLANDAFEIGQPDGARPQDEPHARPPTIRLYSGLKPMR